MAGRATSAVAPSLERIAAAEARAAQDYRASVDARHKANATPIPKLTARAHAGVSALAATPDEARAELWRGHHGGPGDRPRTAALLGCRYNSGSATTPCAPCCAVAAGRPKWHPCRARTRQPSPWSAESFTQSGKVSARKTLSV